MPEVGPSMPGIDPDGEWFNWLDLPDWTWDGVVDGTVVTATGLVFVLVLTLLLLVPAIQLAWTPGKVRNWTLASLMALPGGAIVFAGMDPAAPIEQFHTGASELLTGNPVHGLLLMAVLLVPASWIAATAAVTNRRVKAATNGFRSPVRTERVLWAQAQREQRAAARLARYRLPFTTGGMDPHPVFGRLAVEETQAPPTSRFRALTARTETRLIVPWINMREHMVSVASSGKGKTTLMHRAILSWFVTAWMRHRQWWRVDRPGRPLVMVLDCNGGPESVKSARQLERWMLKLGVPAERIGIFPLNCQLDMWQMPRDDMRSVLSAMISGGSTPTTDTEKYFHEIRENLIHLIVDAPMEVVDREPVGENPPRSWMEFLSRFDGKTLAKLWGGTFDPGKNAAGWAGVVGADLKISACMQGEQPVLTSALAEFSNLYRSLGDAFDGDKQLTDYDALYVVLEGVTTPDRARSQFGALGCMFEQLANKDHGRESLLAVDEFSAVSDGKTRADKWVMRLRKAKIGTWWFAQDWNGLGHDDEQRESLVAAGSGGAVLGGQQRGEKLAETFGTKKGFDLSRKLVGGSVAGDEGNIQAHDKFLIDPNRLRRMDKGDIVHVANGRARWGRVSPLDEATYNALRPLPGLDRFTEPTPEQVAPVIDLTKRRPA
ncbi:hypothetical protein [Nocardia sp. NPDC002869]|uniref:hypothetical protein n=1 Tax=Nocardia sp. NPDC002869 TaxID=3161032 RepID=UPI00398C933A